MVGERFRIGIRRGIVMSDFLSSTVNSQSMTSRCCLTLNCDLQVISARRGEFETGFDRGGQTREHATLAKTMGVRKLIVAVNKMDDPTVNWEKSRWVVFRSTLSSIGVHGGV